MPLTPEETKERNRLSAAAYRARNKEAIGAKRREHYKLTYQPKPRVKSFARRPRPAQVLPELEKPADTEKAKSLRERFHRFQHENKINHKPLLFRS
jgi:hypothetical protein